MAPKEERTEQRLILDLNVEWARIYTPVRTSPNSNSSRFGLKGTLVNNQELVKEIICESVLPPVVVVEGERNNHTGILQLARDANILDMLFTQIQATVSVVFMVWERSKGTSKHQIIVSYKLKAVKVHQNELWRRYDELTSEPFQNIDHAIHL